MPVTYFNLTLLIGSNAVKMILPVNSITKLLLVDAETCMMKSPQPQDATIVFGTSSISYAEKLLLQKYRRNLVLPSSARPVSIVHNNNLNDCDQKTFSVGT